MSRLNSSSSSSLNRSLTYRFETLSIHAGSSNDPLTGAVVTPIYQTTTYAQDELGGSPDWCYARTGNPTRSALEANLAALEGEAPDGEECLLTYRGVARIFRGHLRCGDEPRRGKLHFAVHQVRDTLEIARAATDGTVARQQRQNEAGASVAQLQAENMISLPLDPLPNILLWSDDIVGNVADNPILGPFVDMNNWGLAS